MAGGLWGKDTGQLAPAGVGNVPQEQTNMWGQIAQDSGLLDMGKQALGMSNENQIQQIYQLMATHPNEVVLFFLHYPDFLKNFVECFRIVMRQEIYNAFNSGMLLNAENRPMMVDAAVAASEGYSSITEENLTSALSKTVPLEKMQMEVHEADVKAMNMIQQSQMGMMAGQYQHQMAAMQPQQMTPQQQQYAMQMQMQQQRPGIAPVASNLIRGVLGLPPAHMQMYPQQGYGYPNTGYPQGSIPTAPSGQ